MYAILDIEATGGKKGEEDIIEVAIYRYDGKNVVDQVISLVSPGREIDAYVQKLTQITTKMVRTAPKFYELAKRIIEITDGAILVGHNVDFDYRMLKQEFKKLGYPYYRETIDTVPLSEKYFPGADSYSLGKLSKQLGIPVSDRHRAAGDARATLELFKLLQAKDFQKDISKKENSVKEVLPSGKFSKYYESLPNSPGIFYLFDKDGRVIYLSKSLNTAQGIRKILTGKTGLSNQIRLNLSHVKAEATGNELISWIKEYHEIKKLNPVFNSGKRKIYFPYCICLSEKDGYKKLIVCRPQKENAVLLRMSSLSFAQKFLSLITEEYELCPLLNEASPGGQHCFGYEVGECRGACVGEESAEEYNKRVDDFLEKIDLKKRRFLIIGNGRFPGEKSFVWMKDGICHGYGYYEFHHQIKNPKRIRERMVPIGPDDDIDSIIKGFLFTEKYLEIIPLNID